jgi:hypothetical protein
VIRDDALIVLGVMWLFTISLLVWRIHCNLWHVRDAVDSSLRLHLSQAYLEQTGERGDEPG